MTNKTKQVKQPDNSYNLRIRELESDNKSPVNVELVSFTEGPYKEHSSGLILRYSGKPILDNVSLKDKIAFNYNLNLLIESHNRLFGSYPANISIDVKDIFVSELITKLAQLKNIPVSFIVRPKLGNTTILHGGIKVKIKKLIVNCAKKNNFHIHRKECSLIYGAYRSLLENCHGFSGCDKLTDFIIESNLIAMRISNSINSSLISLKTEPNPFVKAFHSIVKETSRACSTDYSGVYRKEMLDLLYKFRNGLFSLNNCSISHSHFLIDSEICLYSMLEHHDGVKNSEQTRAIADFLKIIVKQKIGHGLKMWTV